MLRTSGPTERADTRELIHVHRRDLRHRPSGQCRGGDDAKIAKHAHHRRRGFGVGRRWIFPENLVDEFRRNGSRGQNPDSPRLFERRLWQKTDPRPRCGQLATAHPPVASCPPEYWDRRARRSRRRLGNSARRRSSSETRASARAPAPHSSHGVSRCPERVTHRDSRPTASHTTTRGADDSLP